MELFTRLIIVSLFITASQAAEINDEQLGYSIVLPENWIREVVSDTSRRFFDTTGTYSSTVGIIRYNFGADTIFKQSEDWTRANFIGYSIVIDADPFSTVLYYDTVTARQNDNLWAADAFSCTFSIDTLMFDWGEYIRFTATGTFGFELYAIGELNEIIENIEVYKSIIDNIAITQEASVIVSSPVAASMLHQRQPASFSRINLMGRRMNRSTQNKASQIIIDRNRHRGILR